MFSVSIWANLIDFLGRRSAEAAPTELRRPETPRCMFEMASESEEAPRRYIFGGS